MYSALVFGFWKHVRKAFKVCNSGASSAIYGLVNWRQRQAHKVVCFVMMYPTAQALICQWICSVHGYNVWPGGDIGFCSFGISKILKNRVVVKFKYPHVSGPALYQPNSCKSSNAWSHPKTIVWVAQTQNYTAQNN